MKISESSKEKALLLGVNVLCILAFLPVLLHPHWGLYSDPHQIVENCRVFYSSPTIRWDLIQGYFRPGFHILDLAVWVVSRENPLGFYVFRFAIFLITINCSFQSVKILTGRSFISALVAMSWFCMTPTFEVLYTLDKAETYIACLFSMIIYCYVRTAKKITDARATTFKELSFRALIIFCCSSYAIFTKETGQLSLLLGFLFPISLWLSLWFTSKVEKNELDSARVTRRLWQWAMLSCCMPALALGCYKLYFLAGNGQRASYGALSFDFSFLIKQLGTYTNAEPDFFLILIFALTGICVLLFSIVEKGDYKSRHSFFFSAGLIGIAVAGAVVLLGWKSIIIYSWFPFLALVLPAFGTIIHQLFKTFQLRERYALLMFLLLALLVLPTRIVDAQLQFQLDESVKELVEKTAACSLPPATGVGLPFIRSEYAELVEELESLTLSQLVPNYVERARNQSKLLPISFFDFINYSFPNGVTVAPKTIPLISGIVEKLDVNLAPDFRIEPGLKKYSYWSDAGQSRHWVVDNLKEGDVFLVPFGDIPLQFASYRGIGLFCTDAATKMLFMPQVQFEPLFTVQRKIWRIGNKRLTIGWSALRVRTLPRMSWFIDRGGNLHEGASIFAPSDISGKTLEIGADLSRAMLIWQRENGTDLPANSRLSQDKQLFLDVRLPVTKPIK